MEEEVIGSKVGGSGSGVTINGTPTDNAIITADGVGGNLQYRSNVLINDNGELTANGDTDRTNTFGRVVLHSNTSDVAFVSHYDHTAAANSGFSQNASGTVLINAPTGQTVGLGINGSALASLSATAFSPASDGGIDLGGSSLNWADLYMNGVLHIADANDTIVIGSNGTITAAITDVTVIGANATATAANSTGVGEGITLGTNSAMVGRNANNSSGTGAGIGYAITAGANSVAVGPLANAGNNTSMAFGRGATGPSNGICFGSSGFSYRDMYLGQGQSATSPDAAITINATGGNGTNIHASDLTLRAGNSTGNATPASVIIQSTTAGASGTGAQSYVTRFEANGTGIAFFAGTPAAQPTGYTTFANLSTVRTLDADATSVAELADVLGTLIEDIKSLNLVSA